MKGIFVMNRILVLLCILLIICPAVVFAANIDIDTDSNDAVDIVYGGTNAATESGARTNLGLGSALEDGDALVGEDAQNSYAKIKILLSEIWTYIQGKADSAYQAILSEGAFDDGDKTKLDTIEESADVTDATNVAAAGALMDSGTDNIDDNHINWGTGAGQVSAADQPIADTGDIITATEVEAALQEIKTAVDLNTDKETNTDDQTATEVSTSTANFDGNLNGSDTTVQAALETLDEMSGSGDDLGSATAGDVVGLFTGTPDGNKYLKDDGTLDTPSGAAHDALTLAASATTGGLSLSTQELAFRAATNSQTGYATAAQIQAIEANTAKETNTDDQTIDVLSLNGTTLSISLEDDGEENQTIDLAGLQDGTGTDDQVASEVTFTPYGNLGATDTQAAIQELDDEKQASLSNPVTSDGSTTTENQIPQFTGTNNQLKDSLGLTTTVGDPGSDTNLVSEQGIREAIDAIPGGTDDQTIDVLSFAGTTLSISLEDDGEVTQTVDLAGLQDGTGTDDQDATEVDLTATYDNSTNDAPENGDSVEDAIGFLHANIADILTALNLSQGETALGVVSMEGMATTADAGDRYFEADNDTETLSTSLDDVAGRLAWSDTDSLWHLSDGTDWNDYLLTNNSFSGNTETGITITPQSDGTVDAVVSVSTNEIAAATLVTEAEGISSNDNDTTVPTSAAVNDLVASVSGITVDDTPNDGDTGDAISSNWAYDHVAAADPHTGYVLESSYGTGVATALGNEAGAADGVALYNDTPTQASLSIDDLISLSGRAEGSTTIEDPNGDITATTIDGALTEIAAAVELNTDKVSFTWDYDFGDLINAADLAVIEAISMTQGGLIMGGPEQWSQLTPGTSGYPLLSQGTGSNLVYGQVDSGGIASGAIDLAHMSAESVDSAQYVDGSIDNAHLADDAVGTDELADDAVNMDRIDEDSNYTDFTGDIATTGIIRGRLQVGDDAVNNTLTLEEINGMIHDNDGDTWVLPDVDAGGEGNAVCFYSTGANAVTVDPDAEDMIRDTFEDGALEDAGDSITSDATAGNMICLVVTDMAGDVAHWSITSENGTWTPEDD